MIISIVIPVYNAEKNLKELIRLIQSTLVEITHEYEIIFIEDNSNDNSWDLIKESTILNVKIKGIKLSRNFGQHNSIACGLKAAKGEWIVVMDCDLQDNPSEICRLFNKAKEGFDIVQARRINRQDSFFKKLYSRIFYMIFSYLTDTKQDNTVSNFGIYNKKVIDSINKMGDSCRFFPILVQWVGFNKTYINVEHHARFEGKSSYTFLKLFNMAINIIISFSEKPLKLILKLGLITSITSFGFALYYFLLYYFGKILVLGFTSIVILICFSTGIILTFLGIFGLYIARISNQVKQRPNFIISEITN